jgi:hypothetical protein
MCLECHSGRTSSIENIYNLNQLKRRTPVRGGAERARAARIEKTRRVTAGQLFPLGVLSESAD